MAGGKNNRNKKSEKQKKKKKEKRARHVANASASSSADFNYDDFSQQLKKLNLKLKEVEGDGNCLFRALADQTSGNPETHLGLRRDVVDYMKKHPEDFQPFVEDFPDHLRCLSEAGTYGGNDSIVAFARLYGVSIVIHQFNTPLWTVHGKVNNSKKQLHISYHNGDHFNSVRNIQENPHEAHRPANVYLNMNYTSSNDKDEDADDSDSEADGNVSDYENVISSPEIRRRARKVRDQSGMGDMKVIRRALEESEYDVESAVDLVWSLKKEGAFYGGKGNNKDVVDKDINPAIVALSI